MSNDSCNAQRGYCKLCFSSCINGQTAIVSVCMRLICAAPLRYYLYADYTAFHKIVKGQDASLC